MSDQRYTYRRPGGGAVVDVSLARLMEAAASHVVLGQGRFDIVKDDHYHHPNLKRKRAIQVALGMAKEIHVGHHVKIVGDKGVEFAFHRVANQVLYDNPLRDCVGLFAERIDEGVDYGVRKDSPVYAIGPGRIITYRESTGWPGDNSPDGGAYIAYVLTDGPAEGFASYDAEHITLNPRLKVGDHVDKDTVIATHHPGFANCEMGWDSGKPGYDTPLANTAPNHYTEGDRCALGDNYSDLLKALGAPAGLTTGRSTKGTVPKGLRINWAKAL